MPKQPRRLAAVKPEEKLFQGAFQRTVQDNLLWLHVVSYKLSTFVGSHQHLLGSRGELHRPAFVKKVRNRLVGNLPILRGRSSGSRRHQGRRPIPGARPSSAPRLVSALNMIYTLEPNERAPDLCVRKKIRG